MCTVLTPANIRSLERMVSVLTFLVQQADHVGKTDGVPSADSEIR